MTDQTPTCPTCGIDLRYPTGLHVVDCPATQTDQTPTTEADAVRDRIMDRIFTLGEAASRRSAPTGYDPERRRGYQEALADLSLWIEADRG